jgi:para-aminobenzoate synthetase component 1
LRAKEYICAGDIFQVNLSQRLSAPAEGDHLSLYKRLRKINPSPFACYLELDGLTVVSCSPERLVKLHQGMLETRPIAGTRPRGKTHQEDEALWAELILNEKERAEHIMLVDLERNDLGRICEYGSVRVDELMVVEDYSHVFHIVSNIQGKAKKGCDFADVIRACFPGGTITGTPKIRSMEIIDEFEPTRRGLYTGSIGYISFAGEMDLNIVIRTFIIKDGMAYIQVGAGIVADSVPEREYHETLHKAQALVTALQS